MDGSGSDDATANLVARLARVIGTAQEQLWPMKRSVQARAATDVMYARAADAALAEIRAAVGGIPAPSDADTAALAAWRRAVVGLLGVDEATPRIR